MLFAESTNSGETKSGYSSLKLKMADGSIPINGLSEDTLSLNNKTL
ncbi:MAG TPA: hypothetical protein PKE52_15320 [Bacteroidales bacterium]|nr:hypothetical protein [Bacteroidales bacterium]